MGNQLQKPSDDIEALDNLVAHFWHEDLQLPRESVRAIVSETIYAAIDDEFFDQTLKQLADPFLRKKDDFSQDLFGEIENQISQYSSSRGLEVRFYEAVNNNPNRQR